MKRIFPNRVRENPYFLLFSRENTDAMSFFYKYNEVHSVKDDVA